MCRTKKGVPCVTFPAELQDGILPGGIDVPMLPGRATIGFKRGIFLGRLFTMEVGRRCRAGMFGICDALSLCYAMVYFFTCDTKMAGFFL